MALKIDPDGTETEITVTPTSEDDSSLSRVREIVGGLFECYYVTHFHGSAMNGTIYNRVAVHDSGRGLYNQRATALWAQSKGRPTDDQSAEGMARQMDAVLRGVAVFRSNCEVNW